MGYSLKDFCRDTTAILKTGSSRQHVDKVKAHMERLLVDLVLALQEGRRALDVGLSSIGYLLV